MISVVVPEEIRREAAKAPIAYKLTTLSDFRQSLLSSEKKESEIELSSTKQLRERRALSSLTDSGGAYAKMPSELLPTVEVNLSGASAMRREAEVIRSAGRSFKTPTIDDSGTEATFAAENTSTEATDLVFGSRGGGGYLIRSGVVRVPYELVQDGQNTTEDILRALSRRLAKAGNREFTVGTIAGRPSGVVTSGTVAVTAASATAVTINELHDLVGSLADEYTENAKLMAHPLIFAALRKLVDTAGGPAFEQTSLARIPQIPNNHMPSTLSASGKVLAYGDFSRYRIIDVGPMRIQRLFERYIDTDQIGVEAMQNVDGYLTDSAAIRVLQLAAS